MTEVNDLIAKEREAFLAERDQLTSRIAEIDRRLAAFRAYEDTLRGHGTLPKHPRVGRVGPRREKILTALKSKPMSRGEILTHFGAKGDRLAEWSISNALYNMKAAGILTKDGTRYGCG
jgi:hypothetical protein